MPCSHCKKNPVLAKGLCRGCYYRLRKTGTLEYKYRGKPRAACSVDGCDRPAKAKGYCERHYGNLWRTGEPVPLFGYGERVKHPLYATWDYQKRCAQGRVAAWADFWQFVADAPPKPSGKHMARRYSINEPWGPENFYWHQLAPAATTHKERQRAWRARNPLASKGHSLKKQFGITLDTYMEMYEAQGGRCGICGRQGAPFSASKGKSETLAVDHCHGTGRIRELLCPNCNKGIALFKESPHELRKAISYLQRHKS